MSRPTDEHTELVKSLAQDYLTALSLALDEAHHRIFMRNIKKTGYLTVAQVNRLGKWRMRFGGIAKADYDDIEGLLRTTTSRFRSERLATQVFTWAALEVLDKPRHPVHCAFWADNSALRVAKVVWAEYIERYPPCLVYGDKHVWDEKELPKRSKWWREHYAQHIIDHSTKRIETWIQDFEDERESA